VTLPFFAPPPPMGGQNYGEINYALRRYGRYGVTGALRGQHTQFTDVHKSGITVMPRVIARPARKTFAMARLGRGSLRVLALLENPPAASARLVRAAQSGFTMP